jgi:hypothetical protein
MQIKQVALAKRREVAVVSSDVSRNLVGRIIIVRRKEKEAYVRFVCPNSPEKFCKWVSLESLSGRGPEWLLN